MWLHTNEISLAVCAMHQRIPCPAKVSFFHWTFIDPRNIEYAQKKKIWRVQKNLPGEVTKSKFIYKSIWTATQIKRKIIKAHTSSFLLFITLFINKHTESLGTAYLFFPYHTILIYKMKPKYNYRNTIIK